MASLKQLLSRPIDTPPVITITGEPGVGKTTLATLFPKPVYIPFEEGLQAIPLERRPFAFPLCTSQKQAMGYIQQLIDEDHPFQTLIIDSVTELGSVIENEVIASDPRKPKSINTAFGGYGAGLNAASRRHKMFSNLCLDLHSAREMAIIYVAHSTIENLEPPDADPYTRYALRLDKRAAACYVDMADAVAFVRVSTKYLTKEGSDRTRAIADKSRIIVLHPTGAHISKNRYGIEAPVPWTVKTKNPLLPLIPYYAARIAATPKA